MDRVTNIAWKTTSGTILGGVAYEYDAVESERVILYKLYCICLTIGDGIMGIPRIARCID